MDGIGLMNVSSLAIIKASGDAYICAASIELNGSLDAGSSKITMLMSYTPAAGSTIRVGAPQSVAGQDRNVP